MKNSKVKRDGFVFDLDKAERFSYAEEMKKGYTIIVKPEQPANREKTLLRNPLKSEPT
jgi:hypothetical protein